MNWLRLEMTAGQIFVLDGDEPRRWLHGEEPAVNEYGNKTGNSWYQEYLAGRLYVGQIEDGDSYGQVWAQSALPEPAITRYWWGCAESYSGSGRPSRVWAQATESADVRPDAPDENGDVAYPFNGMGGRVEAGPFATEKEAENAVYAMITDEDGWLEWK